jgi:DNA-binding LacI/PurR family transcriptional regulator
MAQVKLADVAKAAGVSQGTASNVFNRPEVVREEVRRHVLETAGLLGYRGPDVKGRLLRAGRVNAIGVAALEPLAYFFDDPWARSLMTAVGAVCDASGTGIALVSASNQQKLAWNVNSALVDGFILVCVEGGERLVELTRRRQLPFVALALASDDSSISTIGVDNLNGGLLAALHLTDLGHRRIAVLAIGDGDRRVGPLTPDDVTRRMKATSRDRALGYWRALEQVGLGRGDVPVYGTLNDKPTVDAAMEALFSAPQPPTAILAMSDLAALLAIRWLKARGLSVPADVSVVGFDGVPDGALVQPALTTIAQPFDRIAERAVKAVLGDAALSGNEILDVELVIGGTTARLR